MEEEFDFTDVIDKPSPKKEDFDFSDVVEKPNPLKKSGGLFDTIKGAFNSLVTSYNTPATPGQTAKNRDEAFDMISTPYKNAMQRGFNLASQAEIINPYGTDKANIGKVAELQKETESLPASDAYREFNNSKSFGEAAHALVKNPLKVMGELTLESMASLSSYGVTRVGAGAATGGALGSVIPGVGTAAGIGTGSLVGLADTSLALEYASSILDSFKAAGVDVTDPKALEQAFQNDELVSSARAHAYKKAVPIAIFDLVSGGIAGKVSSKPSRTLVSKLAKGTAEFGIQAGMGMTGEASGELLSGEELQPAAILGEGLGEFGTTPIEVTSGILSRAKPSIQQKSIQIDKVINQTADTGDNELNAQIDAGATLSPEEQQQLKQKLYEQESKTRVGGKVQGRGKISSEVGGEESGSSSRSSRDQEVRSEENGVPSEKGEEVNAESIRGNEGQVSEAGTTLEGSQNQSSQDLQQQAQEPSGNQEEQIADATKKVTELQKKFNELPIEENADELIFDLREARRALSKIAGTKRPKTSIQSEIENSINPKQEPIVVKNPANALKEQIKQHYQNIAEGVRKGQKGTNELISKVQAVAKENNLSPSQVNSVLNKIKQTNLFTPGSVSRLNDFVDKVATDAQYADDLSTAQALKSRVAKRAKSKVESIPLDYKLAAKELSKIDPSQVDVKEYQDLATSVIDGFKDPKSPEYAPINIKKVQDFVDRHNNEKKSTEIIDVRDQYGFGDEVTDEEIEQFVNSPDVAQDTFFDNKEDAKRKIIRDKLQRTAEYSKLALESVDEPNQKSKIDKFLKTDLNDLSDGQLVEFVRTVDNIVENNDFSNSARLEAQVDAVEGLQKLLKQNLKAADLGADLGAVKGAVYNVPNMFDAIYSDSDKASKVQQYSGLEDVYNGGSKVESNEHILYDEFSKEAKTIEKKFKKSPLNAETQIQTGVFSTLIRYPKGADPVKALEQSKRNVEQSIKRYKANKQTEQVAADAQKAYDKLKGAKTVDEVIGIMRKDSPEGYAMWQFFNNKFNSEIKGKLKAVSEELHNNPFEELENYTPKVHRVVDISQTSALGEDNTASAFTSDLPSRPKQAKTSLKTSNLLPEGRAINFEFYQNMFRKYRESLYDIETSKPRLTFREFMRLPKSADVLGGMENKQRISENYKKSEEIQRGVGRDYSDAAKFLDEVTGTLRTLGYTAALGSADQFVKQYVPVAQNTMWNLGGDAGLFFSHIPEGSDKLFNMYTIGQRGRRLGGAERGESIQYRMQSQYRNKLLKSLGSIHKLTERGSNIFMYALTKGDVNVAKRS